MGPQTGWLKGLGLESPEALPTHNMFGGWSSAVAYISWGCWTEPLNLASPYSLGFFTAGWLDHRVNIPRESESGETISSFITYIQKSHNITSYIPFIEAITRSHWVQGEGKKILLLMRPVTFWSETRNFARDNSVKCNLPQLISFYEFIVKEGK